MVRLVDPIHTHDIHKLTRLSMEDQDVSIALQGIGKHGEKVGKISLYDKYRTKAGGKGNIINAINMGRIRLHIN